MKKMALLFFLLPTIVIAGELQPFKSDGCSAFPDGTFEQNKLWLACCTAHDLAYWQGGTANERLKADEALEICVAATGEPEIAAVMLAGVRVGGGPLLPTKFRWGYGWSYPRDYQALTKHEAKLVKVSLNKLPNNK